MRYSRGRHTQLAPRSGFEVKENDQASVSHGSQLVVEGRARGRWEGRGSGEKQTWDGV